jgi:uncharacterized protein (TIGR03437 family)
VSFQVTPNTPVLSVSQSGFSFSTNFGSTTPQQTTVVLRNDGLPTNFTIATQSTPAWLTVTPTSGSIGQNQTVQLTVKGDPTGLSAPTYSGTITINSGAPSPVVIKVAFNIQGGSTLSVDQPALSLNANVGSNLTQTAQVNVMNAGASTSFTAAPQVASTWLSISPASGTIAASSSQALAITVNPGSLAAGTYTAIVNVTVSGTVAATFTVKFAVSALGAVSSADYAAGLTPGTIGAVFALGITNTTQSATGLVLPNSIAGVFLTIKDSAGKQFQVGLFFVSPGQVNFEVPETAATGPATLTVQNPQGIVASGTVQIVAVAPSLYTADASGTGPPAALVLFYDGNGNFQKYTLAASCDSSNHCTPAPIDVHAAPLMFLQLYGTGIRNRSDISKVSCNMGGIILSADYAGSQNTFPGLDQVNIKLPLSLAGKGTFSLVLTVDGIATKPVQVTFQ